MFIANPFHKRICPACGTEYYPGNCAIVSAQNPNTFFKPRTSDFVSRIFVTSLTGREYTKKRARYQCPNPDCLHLLPRSDTFTIAIVGDVRSGKSHFIASCINQLKRQETWQVIGCSSILGQDDTDRRYYTKYYDPVYNRKEQIPPTQTSRTEILDPLVYEIVFSEKSRLSPAKTLTLLFYDSSGEDVTNPDRIATYGHYVLDASAVIFLADPLLMPGIKNKLPSSQQPPPLPQGEIEVRTFDALNRVIQTLKQNKGLRPGQSLPTPIAITVSKSDLLRYLTTDPLFLKPASPTNRLDVQELMMIDQEVRELIWEYGDKELLTSSETFQEKIFLAVSPTGWPALGGRFPKIEPIRCFDPMLWALWKLKIITNE
jgi:hypothetical protein